MARGAFYAGPSSVNPRSLGYMDLPGNLLCLCRASATGSVACSRGHVDGQGSLLCRSIRRGLNLLCLSRAPQGLLLALWGTWIHKKTFDASLECHRVRSGYMEVHARMVREAFYAGPSSVKPWHHLRKHALLKDANDFEENVVSKTVVFLLGPPSEGGGRLVIV